VIYVDSSVLLADLLDESRSPPEALWDEDLASSRLLVYEVWNRINAYGLMISHGSRVHCWPA
jgi:predicted nucleic acid-binding protein